MQKLKELPIDKQQSIIQDTIAKNPITILTAETGAGKSTRVPLWMWLKGKKVHVTQPRRIAARSLAHYLTKLAQKTLGEEIGYQTGFDSKQSKATNLLYVTDGVQMIREINGRRHYDILVLDEVHEWNLNQEVLIGMVKKSLKRGFYQKSGKRVVIMSATLQAGKLSKFLGNAPVIEVPGRGYPVNMHHNDPRFLLPDTAQMVELENNVLVFQPGKQEIMTFMDDLERMLAAEKVKAKILPLHAELTIKEQSKVFDHYKLPKVVVATDIAQTSLTIDDIDAVVDSGIKKEVRVIKGIEGLYPVNISAAECKQRAGRAGRVRNGEYFLCADADINDRLPFPEPEIQRLNLESVVLRLLKMNISPLDFPFFHPPSKALVFKAIKRLKMLGAVTEDLEVTDDGNKMAEFPVSLRSARMLMEAQKANPRVLDSAIKCIAILETKGIVNKEAAGQKFLNTPYHSDLLNQLALWQNANRSRKSINWKKFNLAKEIHKELNKRLGIKTPAGSGLNSKDIPLLYRAILSCFADELYEKGGQEYTRDNEIRQLDRDSVLNEARPNMVVGLPFDLVITRENPNTGEKEENYFPLLTFSSEITLDLLDELKPFSFYKREKVIFKQAKVAIFRQFYFGGRLIKEFTSPPRWGIPEERSRTAAEVGQWFLDNAERYPELAGRMEKLKEDFEIASSVLETPLKSFDFYRRKFMFREIDAQLKMDDLDMFFNFHSGFKLLHLGKILPSSVIRDLKRAKWPKLQVVNGEARDVEYISGRAFIRFEYANFTKAVQREMVLPTGEEARVILGNRKLKDWEHAVYDYNDWKRRDMFEKKFRDLKKPAHMDDLLEIPFPQTFEACKGKNNIPLEFYITPKIEGDDAFLVHFFEKENAETYFSEIREDWKKYVQRYKSRKIENIFKAKGWKVK